MVAKLWGENIKGKGVRFRAGLEMQGTKKLRLTLNRSFFISLVSMWLMPLHRAQAQVKYGFWEGLSVKAEL
jgi:hypothetical protein